MLTFINKITGICLPGSGLWPRWKILASLAGVDAHQVLDLMPLPKPQSPVPPWHWPPSHDHSPCPARPARAANAGATGAELSCANLVGTTAWSCRWPGPVAYAGYMRSPSWLVFPLPVTFPAGSVANC